MNVTYYEQVLIKLKNEEEKEQKSGFLCISLGASLLEYLLACRGVIWTDREAVRTGLYCWSWLIL